MEADSQFLGEKVEHDPGGRVELEPLDTDLRVRDR